MFLLFVGMVSVSQVDQTPYVAKADLDILIFLPLPATGMGQNDQPKPSLKVLVCARSKCHRPGTKLLACEFWEIFIHIIVGHFNTLNHQEATHFVFTKQGPTLFW